MPNTNDDLSLIVSLNSNITHTYQITINYDGVPTGTFSARIGIIKPSVLIARQSTSSNELFWEHRENITEVTFEDSVNIPNGVTSWDVSSNQDESVMAYIIDDGLGTNTYHLYIQSNGILNANPNSSNLFRYLKKLKTINNLSNFNTIFVIDMYEMFFECSNLASIDLSSFITFNTSNMSAMFTGCSSLTSLDLSNFNTFLVTGMSRMFENCHSLTNIDLSNATFESLWEYEAMFLGTTSGVNVIVKDVEAQTFIESRAAGMALTGNIIIYEP